MGSEMCIRDRYESYVVMHLPEIARRLVERDRPEALACILGRGLWSREGLESAVDAAARNKKPEILSYLMNEKHLLFPENRRKRFEL